ncbi:hypothetical protein BJF78_32765 [Pseudonocardia sp. CNS-139]|nr:hypothetical protein BJF78_32765 [Pseudonocardia sp. CNS-139]
MLDQPMTDMTVRSVTPSRSRTVAAVCRASCRRRSGTPARSSSRFHSAQSACGLSGRPVGVVKT